MTSLPVSCGTVLIQHVIGWSLRKQECESRKKIVEEITSAISNPMKTVILEIEEAERKPEEERENS